LRPFRIASSLPPEDADLLRAQLRVEAVKVAAAQADLRLSQETVRNSLRAAPFDADAMRAAMAENRIARQNFDQVLHDTIAAAAAKMSDVGRAKLAEWPAERDNARPLR
jgi:Heavy-metal resistance